MRRGVFFADGPSDLPLVRHLEALCARRGVDVTITPVDTRLLGPAGSTVADRLRFLVATDDAPDLVFVHRDAEGQRPEAREREVLDAAGAVGVHAPVVPVVPVRMTEAWLLLDERAIRHVAGRPHGKKPLSLPPVDRVERLADPKLVLAEALIQASEVSGRRLSMFRRDFPRHRALLIERLDIDGPVRNLTAWRRLEALLRETLPKLSRS